MANELTERQISTDIGQLKADLSSRKGKWIRNYNRYVNNGYRRDQLENIYNPPQAFWYMAGEADTGPIPVANALRSAIQSLCSKISQTKVRPFFNPINGTWKTRKAARGALQFFDQYFDEQEVYAKGIEIRRDAAIFEVGVAKVDDDSGKIRRVYPWNYYFDRAEYHYRGERGLTRCYEEFHHFPKRFFLPEYRAEVDWLKGFEKSIVDEPIKKCEYGEYYDLAGRKKTYWIDGNKVGERPIEFGVTPYVMLYQERPLKGAYSTSLVDDGYTLQTMVDMIMERIELAVELTPASIVLLPVDSEIKKSMFSNQVMSIYEYQPIAMAPNGPTFVTPTPVNDQYIELAKWFTEQIFNFLGISQLSAQSKKPAGLDSGVALETVQDVESERFQVVIDDQTNFYMRLTDRVIDVFPGPAKLFEKHLGRVSVTWNEIRAQRDSFSIQFAPASALSKDPSTKMEEVEKLVGMHVIPEGMEAEYLEFPDLEKLEGKLTAPTDVIEYIIERAAEKAEFDYDWIVPGEMLEQKLQVEIYHLRASGDDSREVENLLAFYDVVHKNNMALMKVAKPPQPPVQQMPPQAPPGGGPPVQAPPEAQPQPEQAPAEPLPQQGVA